MLASVQQRPPPSANCANTIRVTTGERWRTGVNETQTETSTLRLDSGAGAGGSFGRGGGIEGVLGGGARGAGGRARRGCGRSPPAQRGAGVDAGDRGGSRHRQDPPGAE